MDEIEVDIEDITTEADIHLCLCEEKDCVINHMELHFVIDTEQVQDILDFIDVDTIEEVYPIDDMLKTRNNGYLLFDEIEGVKTDE